MGYKNRQGLSDVPLLMRLIEKQLRGLEKVGATPLRAPLRLWLAQGLGNIAGS